MPLVANRDCGRARQRQQRIRKKARPRKANPPGAQPGKANQSIAEEVACLADVKVNHVPARIAHRSEDHLAESAERARRVVGAQPYSRLDRNDGDANYHRPPGADPESGSIACAISRGAIEKSLKRSLLDGSAARITRHARATRHTPFTRHDSSALRA